MTFVPLGSIFIAFAVLAAAPSLAKDHLAGRLDANAAPMFRSDGPGGVVLVAKNGEPVLRAAYGMADIALGIAMRPDHAFKIASLTKQFTAVAILQLASQGQIALGDDVRDYVPGFDTQGRRTSIEHILTHTSGLPNLVDRDDFPTLSQQEHALEQLLRLTDGMAFHFEPGMGFRYSDSGYILLGAVIERVSGVAYGDYIEKNIFRPFGLHESCDADVGPCASRLAKGYELRDGKPVEAQYISMSVAHAAGGIVSTAGDLLRWHLALRAGDVVPEELLARAWTGRALPDGTLSGYGFGWQICTLAGERTIEHGGFINGFTANAIMMPDAGLDVIVLVNNGSDAPAAGTVARRLARLAITGTPEPSVSILTGEQRIALTGRYDKAKGGWLDVFDRDGTLYVARDGGQPRALAALSPTTLTAVDGDEEIAYDFELGPDGKARKLRTSLRCEPVDTAQR